MTGRRRGRLLAVALVPALALVVAACGVDVDAGRGGAPGAAQDGPAALEWHDCGRDVECATLPVPLDHGDPGGATLGLALGRVTAGDGDRRLGTVVMNPGGPGASGIAALQQGFRLPGEAGARFDVVSWDPRGVGASGRLGCDGPVAAFRHADPSPDGTAERDALARAAAAVADACAAAAGAAGTGTGERLAFLGSDQTVEDVDAIRRALGGEPIAFVGFSYGTLLGQWYAERHPDGLRALVLEGVVDPRIGLTGLLEGQALAMEAELAEQLGGAAATWDRVAARVEAEPLPGGPAGVGPAELATAALGPFYAPERWPELLAALAAAEDGDGSALAAFAAGYAAAADYPAYAATACVDSPVPRGAGAWLAFAHEVAAAAPRLGAMVANELLPCATWAAPPSTEPHAVTAPGAPPALVIGATGDAVTPLRWAEQVAADLEGAALLVREGEGHVRFGADPCVGQAVAAYLVDGDLPAPGTRC